MDFDMKIPENVNQETRDTFKTAEYWRLCIIGDKTPENLHKCFWAFRDALHAAKKEEKDALKDMSLSEDEKISFIKEIKKWIGRFDLYMKYLNKL